MKSSISILAFVACVCGDVSHLGYDYHATQPMTAYLPPAPVAPPKNNYLPPSASVQMAPIFMDPSNMYLPPPLMAPKQTNIPPIHVMAPITRPSNNYLPPMTPKTTYIPPAPKNSYIPPAFKPESVMAPRNTFVSHTQITPKLSYIPPMNTYLPPDDYSSPKKQIITPPAPRLEDLIAPQPPQTHYEDSEVFTDDGYKTVRKHK